MTVSMSLLVDGRAFSLQQKGGVSQIWAKIIASANFAAAFDTSVLLYPGHEKNIHLQESGLLSDQNVRKIISDIPPSDNHNHGSADSAKRREATLKQALAGRTPDIVVNTYYGENVLPDCPRYLVVVHDFAHEDLPGLKAKPTTAAVVQRKVQSMEFASEIVYISGFTRNRAYSLYPHLKGRKDAIIFHGHEDASFSIPRIRGKFVHIGNRAGYKNFGLVSKVFEKVLKADPDITLALLGGEAADDQINMLVNGFPGRVAFETNVSDERIFSEIASSTGFISASEYEGFGIPILNALHLGTRPILSDIPPYREIASHFGHFFKPDSPSELEGLIGLVAKTPTAVVPNAFRPWDRVALDYIDFIKGKS